MSINGFLIIIAVAGFTFYAFFADRELQRLDTATLVEQKLVSDIFSDLALTRELVELYLQGGDPTVLDRYDKTYPHLVDKVSTFSRIERAEKDNRTVIDFRYMIQSYLEEANSAILSRKDASIPDSNRHYYEALNINKLINRQIAAIFGVMTNDGDHLRKEAERVRRQNIVIDVILVLAVIALLVRFIHQVSRRIILPLERLNRAAMQVSAGNLEPDSGYGEGDWEITKFGESFDSMLATIRNQLTRLDETVRIEARLHDEELANQRMSILVKEAELESLQSKINPHFLFNTLNMISQMAYMENAQTTTSLLESMSGLLRYTMDNIDKKVTIGNEVKNLRDYLYVQNLRFGERITFFVECDREAECVSVPCLTLQPIVENAITHGVKSYIKDAEVRISIAHAGGRVAIRVSDNGIGMESDRLSAVRESLVCVDGEKSGIGLRNVYKRLCIFYGGDFGFEIQSRRGEGTVIAIDLPFPVKEV